MLYRGSNMTLTAHPYPPRNPTLQTAQLTTLCRSAQITKVRLTKNSEGAKCKQISSVANENEKPRVSAA
jgi:hypothetical protein